jgi:hypothetical protein
MSLRDLVADLKVFRAGFARKMMHGKYSHVFRVLLLTGMVQVVDHVQSEDRIQTGISNRLTFGGAGQGQNTHSNGCEPWELWGNWNHARLMDENRQSSRCVALKNRFKISLNC